MQFIEETSRQKRNKPCENCRSHRRKCIVFDKSNCERCRDLNLECIYKISEKPVKLFKPSISHSRKKRLYEAIWMLNQETDSIQLELTQLQCHLATAKNQTPYCTCTDPPQCTHSLKLLPSAHQTSSEWGLTITSNRNGSFHVQTTIRSLSDLSNFVKEAFSVFKYNINIDQMPEASGKQLIPLTNKTLKIETAVRNLVGALGLRTTENERRRHHSLAESLIKKCQLRTRLKMDIIKEYFSCFGRLNPILIQPYYFPLLMSNPDSLVATSIVAMTAYSKCQHINWTGFSFSRHQFAESCRLEAKSMLEDILFESEPSLDICIALWAISASSTLACKGKESRFQSSICWNMTIQLKNTLLHQQSNSSNITSIEDNIHRETLRRLFYTVRYSEVNFQFIYDQGRDFECIASNTQIGLPSPVPCETSNDQTITSVYCYRYLSQLSINAAGAGQNSDAEMSKLRLFAGVIDEISSTTIEYLEHTTLYMWNNIPTSLRLGAGPFQYANPQSIYDCSNPCILRFNLIFYVVYWMNAQTRVMQSPCETDLVGAAFGRIDGERALVLASICSDTATKLFQSLAKLLPCAIKLHWLTICIEVLERLSNCVNEPIKLRAQSNLDDLIEVLRHQLAYLENVFPPTPNEAYFAQMKQIISSHMAVNKICIV